MIYYVNLDIYNIALNIKNILIFYSENVKFLFPSAKVKLKITHQLFQSLFLRVENYQRCYIRLTNGKT